MQWKGTIGIVMARNSNNLAYVHICENIRKLSGV